MLNVEFGLTNSKMHCSADMNKGGRYRNKFSAKFKSQSALFL